MAPSTGLSNIAVAHPRLLVGGSEMTAMWTLHALQGDFRLTLLTGGPVDWHCLNKICGTEVDPKRIKVLQAPMPSGLKRMAAGDALRGAFMQRMCRRVGPRFDLCVSTYNFIDFGAPALQFTADFSWDDALRRRYDRDAQHGVRGLMQRQSPLRVAYLRAARLIAGGREHGRAGDVVIANSRWTADTLERRHGMQASVIYPPVHIWPPVTAAHPRSGDFVLLGRLSPEKRVEEAIEVLRGVRARGHNVRLHIIGPLDGSAYSRRVRTRRPRRRALGGAARRALWARQAAHVGLSRLRHSHVRTGGLWHCGRRDGPSRRCAFCSRQQRSCRDRGR